MNNNVFEFYRIVFVTFLVGIVVGLIVVTWIAWNLAILVGIVAAFVALGIQLWLLTR